MPTEGFPRTPCTVDISIDEIIETLRKVVVGATVGRNRAPVEVGSLSHYLQGFVHPRWLARFLPSTVCCLIFLLAMGLLVALDSDFLHFMPFHSITSEIIKSKRSSLVPYMSLV